MTLKDLQRLVQSSQSQQGQGGQSQKLRIRLEGKPFWYFDISRHKEKNQSQKNHCCFNHIIGLPKKDGKAKPLWDYEGLLFKALVDPRYLNSHPSGNTAFPFKEKHLWVKKATGLGVTEFMLRFMAWLCLHNGEYHNSQMVIVTGPNQELAIKLIKRIKALFEPAGITFDSKETVIELNGCSIEAYPSNHIDAFRSLTNPKFILLDEGDFMPKFQQDDVRHVSERYIAKSDPFIVMVSTPNAPGGLFQKIEQESFDTCIYKKIFLDYTYGLGKIYSKEEIDKARMSPSFPREYELKYSGLIGNVFSTQSIENCQKIEYNYSIFNQNAKHSCGLDPGFGSSKFGIVVTEYSDGIIKVMFADEFERASFQSMIDKVWEIKQKCGLLSNIFCDASNPEVWQALKKEFGEPYNQQYINDQRIECRKYNFNLEDRMIIVPVPFSVEGGHMLQHCKWLMEETEEDGSRLNCNPQQL